MNEHAIADQGPRLLALYDRALPQVYGYLVARVGDPTVAEDLTGETFLAAVRAVQDAKVPDLTIGWLVTVAPPGAAPLQNGTFGDERATPEKDTPGSDEKE